MTKKHEFESIASEYAKSVDEKPIHRYYERPNLLALLPDNIEDLEILDLGCGSGWYAEQLVKKRAKITALDVSPTMVQLTKERLGKNGDRVYQADLEKPLHFLPDNSFDIIIAPLVIHYIKEWKPLFLELAKKLKSGGLFIFSTHSPYIEFSLFNLENYFFKTQINDEWKDVGTVTFYHHTLHELSQSLHEAGFVIEQLVEPQPEPELKKIDSQLYKKLSTHPWFLFGKAIKL